MVFGKANCFNIHNIADQSLTFYQSRVPSLEDEMATDAKSQRRFAAKKMASVCNFYVQTFLWYSCTCTTWTE